MLLLRNFLLSLLLFTNPCLAHEAWVLSPTEFEDLASAPVPGIFLSSTTLLTASSIAMVFVSIALWLQNRLQYIDDLASEFMPAIGVVFGGIILRLGLAIPIGLGALGALPRHGTDLWSEPTFFVPDMQLSQLAGNTELLLQLCYATAILLALGLFTRTASVAVIAMVLVGGHLFGSTFIYCYAAHFITPAIILVWLGPGRWSVDHLIRSRELDPLEKISEPWLDYVWPVILLMTGSAFVYLSLSLKLAHPTLLIAILEHGGLDKLGIPLSWIALVMTGVELIAGLLLLLGHLVRPIAVFLLCAFTFFSIILGETPLFHANLYALSLMLLLFGSKPKSESLRNITWHIRTH